ncbi:hypothetical protein [Kitasatospora sp. LaBMicrA B282]|uniref:hypothetical protein n=1 Tax=Kitasatospora sp. LaBMicrA B282 TaxID=3420949 RepID=UPI003D0FF69B
MLTLTMTRAARVTALTAATAFLALAASPAQAAALPGGDKPQTVAIAAGATAPVPWTYENTGPEVIVLPPNGTGTMVFQAPGNTTFPTQSTVLSTGSLDGGTTWIANALALQNCTVSNGGQTLSCTAVNTSGSADNILWPQNTFFRFQPQVTVNADAPTATTLAPGTGRLTDTAGDTADATLNVTTPQVQAAPLADPAIAGTTTAGLATTAALLTRLRRRTR